MAFCKALPSGKWLVINWRVCQTVICKLVWGEGKSSHSSDLVEIRCGLQIALYMEMRVMDRLQAGHVLWEVWIRIANLILSLIILQEIAVQKNCMSYTIYIYINIYLLYVHMYISIYCICMYVYIYIYAMTLYSCLVVKRVLVGCQAAFLHCVVGASGRQ